MDMQLDIKDPTCPSALCFNIDIAILTTILCILLCPPSLKIQNRNLLLPVGIQVSCPYLYCSSKNSQFQNAGRFPSGA